MSRPVLRSPALKGPVLKDLGHRVALQRVRDWTRVRFGLPTEALISVTERDGTIPGGPPIETAVGFWTDEATRYHFRVFTPVAAIVEDDLPYAWQRDALAVPPDWACDCC